MARRCTGCFWPRRVVEREGDDQYASLEEHGYAQLKEGPNDGAGDNDDDDEHSGGADDDGELSDGMAMLRRPRMREPSVVLRAAARATALLGASLTPADATTLLDELMPLLTTRYTEELSTEMLRLALIVMRNVVLRVLRSAVATAGAAPAPLTSVSAAVHAGDVGRRRTRSRSVAPSQRELAFLDTTPGTQLGRLQRVVDDALVATRDALGQAGDVFALSSMPLPSTEGGDDAEQLLPRASSFSRNMRSSTQSLLTANACSDELTESRGDADSGTGGNASVVASLFDPNRPTVPELRARGASDAAWRQRTSVVEPLVRMVEWLKSVLPGDDVTERFLVGGALLLPLATLNSDTKGKHTTRFDVNVAPALQAVRCLCVAM